MRLLKDKVYIHYFIDIDGLIVDLISLEVDKDELDENYKLQDLFNKLLSLRLLDIRVINTSLVGKAKLYGFSTLEGHCEIIYDNNF